MSILTLDAEGSLDNEAATGHLLNDRRTSNSNAQVLVVNNSNTALSGSVTSTRSIVDGNGTKLVADIDYVTDFNLQAGDFIIGDDIIEILAPVVESSLPAGSITTISKAFPASITLAAGLDFTVTSGDVLLVKGVTGAGFNTAYHITLILGNVETGLILGTSDHTNGLPGIGNFTNASATVYGPGHERFVTFSHTVTATTPHNTSAADGTSIHVALI